MHSRATLDAALRPHGLFVSGVVTEGSLLPEGAASLALLSPNEPEFWPIFASSPEYGDGSPDPLDRWSRRTISDFAQNVEAKALFPFGGPPFAPFLRYALASGEAFSSPLGMIVHAERGLMISYRGALALPYALPRSASSHPCEACDRPCVAACPAHAFADESYNVNACKDWLATPQGTTCVEGACAIRKSCPHSSAARLPEQSQFHMKAFTG